MKSKVVTAGLAAFVGLGMIGCAHSTMRGSVAMKVSESEAHVCMNKDEVKVGDHVELFTNQCTPSGGAKSGSARNFCTKVSRGHGDVMEILNEHYSLVKFETGVKFQEGDFIEKHSH